MKIEIHLVGGPLDGEVKEFWEDDNTFLYSHVVCLDNSDPRIYYTYIRKDQEHFEFVGD